MEQYYKLLSGIPTWVSPSSIDTTAPTVSSFTMSDTALASGETATVRIVFSEAVENLPVMMM